jgi:hypothetical protein
LFKTIPEPASGELRI